LNGIICLDNADLIMSVGFGNFYLMSCPLMNGGTYGKRK